MQKACWRPGLTYVCVQIAKAVDEETVTRDLVPAFVKLLKDTEAEVRTAIAGQIPGNVYGETKHREYFMANISQGFVDC